MSSRNTCLSCGFPFAHIRFGSGDGDFAARHCNGQYLVALGVGIGHDLGNSSEIHLERIDVEVVKVNFFRQPLRQVFQMQRLFRIAQVFPFLIGDKNQRMLIRLERAAVDQQLFAGLLGDEFVGYQIGNNLRQRERAIALRGAGVRALRS
jgi:hypothetical protein